MPRFFVSLGLLFLLVFSLTANSQEVGQTGAVPGEAPQEVSSDPPAPAPAMPGEVIFESSAGNVLFPHMVHLKFGCVACHHQIQAGERDTPHPDYLTSSWINCQSCHNENSQSGSQYYKCSDCHHSEPENIADETLSSKVVIHKSCWKCHQSGTGAQASEGCGECHVKE
jgi:hypothetical protein